MMDNDQAWRVIDNLVIIADKITGMKDDIEVRELKIIELLEKIEERFKMIQDQGDV
jgi:hypothetical protein